MGAPTVMDRVAAYLDLHRGSVRTINDLEREIPNRERATLQRAILTLSDRMNIRVVTQGRAWVYEGGQPATSGAQHTSASRPPTKNVPAPDVLTWAFECVGQLKSGELLIRSDSGRLYKAEEL